MWGYTLFSLLVTKGKNSVGYIYFCLVNEGDYTSIIEQILHSFDYFIEARYIVHL